MAEVKRILVGATGASGMPILKRCLELIKRDPRFESHLVLSDSAKITIKDELYQDDKDVINEITDLADYIYDNKAIDSSIASGSYPMDGMLIVPCSMKTLAGIHSGYSDNLLLRSADVCLKEQRKLILGVREAPFNAIHLRNMYDLSLMQGVKIIPLVMSFYSKPKSIEDMVSHIAFKLVDPFGVDCTGYQRWGN